MFLMIETDKNEIENLKFEPNNGLIEKIKGFDYDLFLSKYKIQLIFLLFGIILTGIGLFLYKNGSFDGLSKVEVLDNTTESQGDENGIVVAISGAVEKPGVYSLEKGSRVEDVLIAAGGVSENANRSWVDKYINRAAKLEDGQKIYIPTTNEQSDVLSARNIDNNVNKY